MWYRIPFFKRLNESFDIKFAFTDFHTIGKIYDSSYKKAIEELKGLDYKILNGTMDLINELRLNHDIIVGGSWDSPHEIFKSLLIYIIGKLKRKRIILFSEEWNWGFSFKRKLISPIVKLFVTLLMQYSYQVQFTKKHFIEIGANPEKIFIMPNATTIKIEEPKKLDKKVVLYVGRLIKRKGVDYLIKAFKKNSKTQIL